MKKFGNIWVVIWGNVNETAITTIVTNVKDNADEYDIQEFLERKGLETGCFGIKWANTSVLHFSELSEEKKAKVLRILNGTDDECENVGTTVIDNVDDVDVVEYEDE